MDAIAMKNLSWKEIAEIVGTRTAAQCKSHHQKLFKGKSNENKKKRNGGEGIDREGVKKRGIDLICKEIQCDSTDGSSTEPNTPQFFGGGEQRVCEGKDEGKEVVEMNEIFDDCFEDQVFYF